MKLHEYKSQNWWNKMSYMFQSRNSVVLATFFNIFKTCCNFWSVQATKILRIAKRSCDQARSISGFKTTKSSTKMAENDDQTFLAFFRLFFLGFWSHFIIKNNNNQIKIIEIISLEIWNKFKMFLKLAAVLVVIGFFQPIVGQDVQCFDVSKN